MMRGGLQVRGNLLDAIDGGQRLRAVEVEDGDAGAVVVLSEMHGVAAEDHRALLRQLDEEAVMPRRMSGRGQHDHAAIAEHILVQRHGLRRLPRR